MSAGTYQIRRCRRDGCGLRYPVVEGQPFSSRCPRCRGSTDQILERILVQESPSLSLSFSPLVSALLDNIRSAGNVGSMFRSADGAGIRRLHLCGITATPENAAVGRTALGAHQRLEWVWHADGVRAAQELLAAGCRLWALEDAPGAASLWDQVIVPERTSIVLVVGNEVVGVDPGILELCERVLYIPMHGAKRSLNAAVAFGIAVYALCHQ